MLFGIVTGKFENTNQIEMAIKKGGIIDSVSDLIDGSLKYANNKGLLDKTVVSLIKNGKNTILKSISNKIDNAINSQAKAIEKLQNYCNNWSKAYDNKDFETMDKAYKNIQTYLKKTIPLETTLVEARTIENLHSLVKNNGGNFNITEEEKNLAQKLVNYP